MIVLGAVALGILVTMALALVRAFLGPTIYDRLLAVNMFGTKTVVLIAVIDYFNGKGEMLDIALVYALINFISVIAVLRLAESGSFVEPSEDRS